MRVQCVVLCVVCWVELTQAVSQCSRPEQGKFWHVTDFHYDHTYGKAGLSCNGPLPSPLPRLGDYWCDSPWTLVIAALDAMATYPEDVDFVLWTGDTIAHISDDQMTQSLNMDMMQNLTNAVAARFPHTPVYPVFGNHDYYPASQFPATSNAIYNRTADMWRQWIQEKEQLEHFRKGGYYTRLLSNSSCQKLRMVVLNTNLYYTSDRATPGITDPAGQLHWFRNLLTTARSQQEKVIVAAHIPPGLNTPRGVFWYQEEFVEPFNAVLREFADVITAMHFGHEHYDGFKVFNDDQGSPAIPIFVAPSVTPWRFKLPSGETGPPHNPSVRLVTYDRHTGRHLDFTQFTMDLSSAPQRGSFTPLYSFTQHYQVPDISAQSLDQLINAMNSTTAQGDALLHHYFRLTSAGVEGDEGCSTSCQRNILCGFRHFTRAGYQQCLTQYDAYHVDNSKHHVDGSSAGAAGIQCKACWVFWVLVVLLFWPVLRRV